MNRNSQTNNHSKQQSSQCKKKPGCRQLVSLSPFPQPLLFFGLSERFFFQRGVKWQFDFKAQGRELISCCCNKDCWSSLIPYIIFKLLFILPLFLLYTILIIFWPALSLFRNLQHCRWEVNQQRPTDLLLRDQLPKTTQTWPGWVGGLDFLKVGFPGVLTSPTFYGLNPLEWAASARALIYKNFDQPVDGDGCCWAECPSPATFRPPAPRKYIFGF